MRENKVRLSLDVSPELNVTLDAIAEQMHTTKSEVLRKAVALIDVSHKARQEGKHVGIAKSQSDLDTEFVGL
jgi:predicted transcriptional regulator